MGAELFPDLSRDVQSDSSLGHSRIIRVVLKSLLGYVLRVVVPLKDELPPQSDVKGVLEQVCIQDVSAHCPGDELCGFLQT